MVKLNLPFRHANNNVLNKNNIVQVKFNTNTKIDNNIIHNKLKEVCDRNNVDYNKVIYYIKNLELQYYKHFLCE